MWGSDKILTTQNLKLEKIYMGYIPHYPHYTTL